MQLANNLSRFRLVTFDVTDTLLRFRAAPAKLYLEAATKYGFENIGEKQLSQCFHQQFKKMSAEHKNYGYNTPNMNWEQWWIQVVKNTFYCVDPDIDQQKLETLANHLLKIFRTKECWEHIDCAKELVRKVRQNVQKVGIISNSDPGLPQVLREMDIEQSFDFVITSYEAGVQKPDRNIFEHALQLSECTKAEQALHIGNSFELDYMGAKQNSGWSSLLVTEKDFKLSVGEKDYVYVSLCDMLVALETRKIQW